MSAAVTDWFPAEVKPVHVGVYETQIDDRPYGFTYWNGSLWSMENFTIEQANADRQGGYCANQDKKWRGLAAPATHTTEGGSNASA